MFKLLVLFSNLLFANVLFSQVDTNLYRSVVRGTVDFSDDFPYGLYKQLNKPYTGWMYDEYANYIALFHVKNGLKHGLSARYKKRGNKYYLVNYKYFLEGACWESAWFAGGKNNRRIKDCMIYHFGSGYYPWYCDPNLLRVKVKYGSESYKIKMTYKYGDDGKLRSIKYKTLKLHNYIEPSLLLGGNTYFPLVLNSLKEIPAPPIME